MRNILLGKLKNALLEEIVNQINKVDKIPVSIFDLEFTKGLSGLIIARETHHIIKTVFSAKVDGNDFYWNYNSGKYYKFPLVKYFSEEEISELKEY